VIREQWIRAKYERQEFVDGSKQLYLSGRREGYLWKRGKDAKHFQRRRFILDATENTLRYYVKEDVSISFSFTFSPITWFRIVFPEARSVCFFFSIMLLLSGDVIKFYEMFASVRSFGCNNSPVLFHANCHMWLPKSVNMYSSVLIYADKQDTLYYRERTTTTTPV